MQARAARLLAVAVVIGGAPPPCPASGDGVRINEIRIDQPGSDLDEYVELAGPPGTTLDGLSYLVIGDGASGSGTLEEVIDLAGHAIGGDGFFVVAEKTFTPGIADLITALNFENSDNVTHLIVSGFTGADGDDLDADDDGALDSPPWDGIIDLVAVIEEPNPPSGTEFHYGPPQVGPDGGAVPAHVYRCSPSLVWRVGPFDPAAGVDTPGAVNADCPCLADLDGTGDVDVLDLVDLLGVWGPCPGCPADINTDGGVNAPDLAFLVDSWGPCTAGPRPGKLDRFTETVAVDATDPDAAAEGFVVTHLYATGPDVGVGDTLLAAGFAGIGAVNATFFQEPVFGGDLPPDSFLFQFEPTLEYDTFVTVNELADDDDSMTAPGFLMDAAAVGGDWFAVPGDGQADAVDIGGLTGNPGQAGVLIAQITLIPCAPRPGVEPALPGYSGAVTLFTFAWGGGTINGVAAEVQVPACPADMDGDDEVGIFEFLAVLADWGVCSCCRADADGDGEVGILDFLAVLETWGMCR